jgi:hypothetical protein
MAIGTAIGAIGSLIVTAIGMYKQEQEAVRARKAYEEEETTAKSQFGANIGIQRESLRQRKLEADRDWKWKNEEQSWQRTQQFTNRFEQVLSQNPEYANNLFNIWRRT